MVWEKTAKRNICTCIYYVFFFLYKLYADMFLFFLYIFKTVK